MGIGNDEKTHHPLKYLPRDKYMEDIRRGIEYQIWSGLNFTGEWEIPTIAPYETDIPSRLIPFDQLRSNSDTKDFVHFYRYDSKFKQVKNNPHLYLSLLKRMSGVIFPDFSQYMDMPAYKRFINSCINKEIAAFWQSRGVRIIAIVTWSDPDSYKYAFEGIPSNCVIAINSVGAKKTSLSKYLWQKGYDEAIKRLTPKAIIRYGEKMSSEYEDISVYFCNERLNIMRNGRKR